MHFLDFHSSIKIRKNSSEFGLKINRHGGVRMENSSKESASDDTELSAAFCTGKFRQIFENGRRTDTDCSLSIAGEK